MGAPNVSRFTWFISGRVVEHKGDDPEARFMRNVTINETDGFAETFEIDTSGYDYFGRLYLKNNKRQDFGSCYFQTGDLSHRLKLRCKVGKYTTKFP